MGSPHDVQHNGLIIENSGFHCETKMVRNWEGEHVCILLVCWVWFEEGRYVVWEWCAIRCLFDLFHIIYGRAAKSPTTIICFSLNITIAKITTPNTATIAETSLRTSLSSSRGNLWLCQSRDSYLSMDEIWLLRKMQTAVAVVAVEDRATSNNPPPNAHRARHILLSSTGGLIRQYPPVSHQQLYQKCNHSSTCRQIQLLVQKGRCVMLMCYGCVHWSRRWNMEQAQGYK